MEIANREGRSGGGLACVYKSRYTVKQTACGAEKSFEYALWNVRLSDADFINVIGIYHPSPSKKNPPVSVFIDEISVFLAEQILQLENVLITGDFNIRINDTEDYEVNTFSDILYSLGLDQHVDFQTHNRGNTVDLIFTESMSKLKILECAQGPFLSDHCVVTCIISINRNMIKREKVKYRKLRSVSVNDLLHDMDLNKIMNSDSDIDELYRLFEEEATKATDIHAPVVEKTLTIRDKKPWYTDEIKEQKRIYRNRERVWKKYGSSETWQALKIERYKYKKMLKQSKKDSITGKVFECAKDSKKLYHLVSEITGTKSLNPLPPDISEKDLCEQFANFFIEKITKIRDGLAENPKFIPIKTRDIINLNKFEPLSEDEIKGIVRSMPTKSCETDALQTKFIKEGLDKLLPVLAKLINVSLENGVFADKWKTTIVRPLLKKANLDLIPCNYRPVSNLSFISKVVEKAALSRFNNHCEHQQLMPDYQSAYRTNYSCETALTKLFNDLLWSMENQEVSALAAIDLSAAFDTIDHDILLDVLAVKFGISGKTFEWFETYLRPRQCKINVGSEYSAPRSLGFSVPQGSCAGPVLYLAYASTMQEIVSDSISLYGYADDHALKNSFKASDRKSESESIRNIEKCMVQIKSWMDSNRLKMNSTKTEFILFGHKTQLKKCETVNISVVGETVERSSDIKYLGVWLDQSLNLKLHIKKKCRIAMLNLQRIKLIRDSLTVEACKVLVHGMVISHLNYANAIFAGLPSCDIMKLQRVQNTAARLILQRSKFESATQCCKELHWLPIRARIDYKISTLIFKCLTNSAPEYLKNLVTYKIPKRHGLRVDLDDKLLVVPFTRRKIFADRSFSVYGPRIWNTLPYNIRNCNNYEAFKTSLKTYLFQREYECDQ